MTLAFTKATRPCAHPYRTCLHEEVWLIVMSVLIRNGRVVDPGNGIKEQDVDVLLDGGKIARVDKNIPLGPDCVAFDASGCLVCPGLVDLHVHCFPSCPLLGIDPDEWALPYGVTTVVDAGSAGMCVHGHVCLSL